MFVLLKRLSIGTAGARVEIATFYISPSFVIPAFYWREWIYQWDAVAAAGAAADNRITAATLLTPHKPGPVNGQNGYKYPQGLTHINKH